VSNLFAELKRRNVFRVAAAYAVVAWLLIQAADIMLGNFGAPEWVFKSFVALLLLGFPLALFLSWAYELTPDGVKRAADVSAETSGSQAGKLIDWLILAGIGVVIVVMVADRVWAPAKPERADAAGRCRRRPRSPGPSLWLSAKPRRACSSPCCHSTTIPLILPTPISPAA
jgi:hypothetical protein